ncbi:hypothetical protein AG1IA_03807 [Rhizoctonia solani AG-1 IA]|uniref:Uncharacterized protein n=1 Tax=Thanatephorus cucumeris (strain AG1-IA) TaxID=983506 RepID=L8WW01_THACA|nr:hypothetical protein AG1IA_03807 [Rhizoctonia solani AG-1 IA]
MLRNDKEDYPCNLSINDYPMVLNSLQSRSTVSYTDTMMGIDCNVGWYSRKSWEKKVFGSGFLTLTQYVHRFPSKDVAELETLGASALLLVHSPDQVLGPLSSDSVDSEKTKCDGIVSNLPSRALLYRGFIDPPFHVR